MQRLTLYALFLGMAVLPLAGLVPAQPAPPGSPDDCRASELQGLVGQPSVVLERMRFAQVVRVIHYGMPVTMDFNPARLNIQLDQRDVIERVSCG